VATTPPTKAAAKKKAANRKRAAATKKAAPSAPPPRTEPMAVPIYDDSKITPVNSWGRADVAGFVIELPSGNYAKVKRTLNLRLLLKAGKIPNPIAAMVQEMLDKKLPKLPSIDPTDVDTQMAMLDFIDSQMCEVFVSPVVQMCPAGWDVDKQGIWKPQDGFLDVAHLSLEDKMYVFAYAQGAALDVAQFRETAHQAVATAQHGSGVDDATVGTAGD
jgi:hypothetical protein